MISGHSKRKIQGLWYIEHNGEGGGLTMPEEGESFWGVPYCFHSDNSMSFIEVVRERKVIRVINTAAVSQIDFA